MAVDLSARAVHLRALIRRHKRWDQLFAVLGVLSLMVGVLTLLALFASMVIDGAPRLSAEFFTNFPSRRAGEAGILSAWVGSILVMFVTALFAVPLGRVTMDRGAAPAWSRRLAAPDPGRMSACL